MTKLNIRTLLLWTLATVFCAGLFSCKKDKNDEDTRSTLRGSLSFDIPAYVAAGEVFELVPTEVKTDDGVLAGIYWSFSHIKTPSRDTTRFEGGTGDGSYILEIPDTLSSITVTCAAFAEGYYNTSASVLVTVVDEETITGLGLPEDTPVFTDPRDGRRYPYVPIGTREWFARNLAADGGYPYQEAAAMQNVFGQYYSWDEAAASCPDGWRLPDAEDWADLAAAAGTDEEDGTLSGVAGLLMADAYMNDKKMWEFYPAVKITNALLYSAIPAGYALDAEGVPSFSGVGQYAVFWTAEEADGERAYCRQFHVSSPDVFKAAMNKASFRAPVRCVRDLPQLSEE